MKSKLRHIAFYIIAIFLMLFWIYIAFNHLWHLQDFYASLGNQPFPDQWAKYLYWLIPAVEVLIFTLIFLSLYPEGQRTMSIPEGHWINRLSYLISAALLFIFSIYIGLGIHGVYGELPCGCASVFGDIEWSSHLIINMMLIGLSIAGWYLKRRTHGHGPFMRYKRAVQLFSAYIVCPGFFLHNVCFILPRRFPRKFALFPGQAGT